MAIMVRVLIEMKPAIAPTKPYTWQPEILKHHIKSTTCDITFQIYFEYL